MSPWMEALLAVAAFVGHFSMAVWLFNRLHAVALPRKIIKTSEQILVTAAATMSVLFVWRWLATCQTFWPAGSFNDIPWLVYVSICWLAWRAAIPLWVVPKLQSSRPVGLISNDTTTVDVARRLGYRPLSGPQFNFVARWPGNELLKVAIQEKTLKLPNLPAALDGLRIAHLSDLHMTGKV